MNLKLTSEGGTHCPETKVKKAKAAAMTCKIDIVDSLVLSENVNRNVAKTCEEFRNRCVLLLFFLSTLFFLLSMGNKSASEDLADYRNGYPGKQDKLNANDNFLFYNGDIQVRR
jgi:hypothetical protein